MLARHRIPDLDRAIGSYTSNLSVSQPCTPSSMGKRTATSDPSAIGGVLDRRDPALVPMEDNLGLVIWVGANLFGRGKVFRRLLNRILGRWG